MKKILMMILAGMMTASAAQAAAVSHAEAYAVASSDVADVAALAASGTLTAEDARFLVGTAKASFQNLMMFKYAVKYSRNTDKGYEKYHADAAVQAVIALFDQYDANAISIEELRAQLAALADREGGTERPGH